MEHVDANAAAGQAVGGSRQPAVTRGTADCQLPTTSSNQCLPDPISSTIAAPPSHVAEVPEQAHEHQASEAPLLDHAPARQALAAPDNAKAPPETAGWWDAARPLPEALRAAIVQQLPEAAWLPGGAPTAPGQLPLRLASLGSRLAETLDDYVEQCRAQADQAALRAALPHVSALAELFDDQLSANPGGWLHERFRLRHAWARGMYALGQYAEADAGSARLGVLAGHLGLAERRAASLLGGLLAIELGRYAEADAALGALGERSMPVAVGSWQSAVSLETADCQLPTAGPPEAGTELMSEDVWRLALARAGLTAAAGDDRRALVAYAALDAPGAPEQLQARAGLGRIRILLAAGRLDQATALLDALHAAGAGAHAGWLALAASEAALAAGQPAQAEAHAELAHAELAALLGSEHPLVAAATLAQAQAAYARGAYASAACWCDQALDRLAAAHGAAHPAVAQALLLRALLAGVAGDTAALHHDIGAALQAARSAAWVSEPAKIQARLIECSLLLTRGRAARAGALALRTLERARAALSATHPLLAGCLDMVAECERAQGRWGVARVYADMALALHEATVGLEHPRTADSWALLGQIALDAQAYRQARDAFELAVQIRHAALGARHPATAAAQLALARACVALGMIEQAEVAAASALAGFEQTFGALHAQSYAARALLGQLSSPLRRRWWRARAWLRVGIAA